MWVHMNGALGIQNLCKWKGEHGACSSSAVKQQQPWWAIVLTRQATGSSSPTTLGSALRWPPAQAEELELTAGKLWTTWGSSGRKSSVPVMCALGVPPNWSVVCVEVCFLCLFFFFLKCAIKKIKIFTSLEMKFQYQLFCHKMEYSYMQQVNYFPWGSDTKLFSIQRTINRLLQLYTLWSRSFPVFRGDACPTAPISAVCQASQ